MGGQIRLVRSNMGDQERPTVRVLVRARSKGELGQREGTALSMVPSATCHQPRTLRVRVRLGRPGDFQGVRY
jgi:hypothetical protein